MATIGSLPQIIRNDERLYEGDLTDYFKAVFNNAQNLFRPYHNFRHMFHVVYLCHDACKFYESRLSQRVGRNLLIAAMFHDFDHPGIFGNDDLNVARSIREFEKYISLFDYPHAASITNIIKATEFPYTIDSRYLALECQIIRDADMSQCFSEAWMQQVLFGLAAEWGKKPSDILGGQINFLGNLEFCTDWGQTRFPQSTITAKIREVEAYIALLE